MLEAELPKKRSDLAFEATFILLGLLDEREMDSSISSSALETELPKNRSDLALEESFLLLDLLLDAREDAANELSSKVRALLPRL